MTFEMLLSFIQHNWMLVLVFIGSGALLAWPLLQRRVSSIKELGTHELTRLINDRDAVLLDVREAKEIEGGRLPNALHIPLSQLQERAAELSSLTGRPVVAYCARGDRNAAAGGALTKLGFSEVYALRGGITAWRSAGLPLSK
ncbi:MAG: rhodanese-like domain-containing protein [Pseudomonadota bacterium]|nr:rhodanese-like domain-containing protein [Pseudomonadota bacterium]